VRKRAHNHGQFGSGSIGLRGYYKTNTAEIAKYAGVSTGALYSCFEDKRQIFIESFHQHLDAISSALLQQLTSLPEQPDLSTFIEKWIEVYIDLSAKSNHALVQLRLVIVDDEEINHHFSALENTYFSNIADIFLFCWWFCGDLSSHILPLPLRFAFAYFSDLLI
jgi:AcrR family transcriptional regulator